MICRFLQLILSHIDIIGFESRSSHLFSYCAFSSPLSVFIYNPPKKSSRTDSKKYEHLQNLTRPVFVIQTSFAQLNFQRNGNLCNDWKVPLIWAFYFILCLSHPSIWGISWCWHVQNSHFFYFNGLFTILRAENPFIMKKKKKKRVPSWIILEIWP